MNAPNPDSPAWKLIAGQRPLVIGHRGCCAFAPENTLPSFKLALEAGADLVELDYHLSQDGVPMVIHDDTLDRTTDARKKWKRKGIKVADLTAAEIQTLDAGSWFDTKFAGARVPLLTEALDLICGTGGVALIEHKSGDVGTCVSLLRERRLINKVAVISFNWEFLRRFHELEPAQALGALGRPELLADGRKPSRLSKKLDAQWLDELANTGAKLAVWNRQVPKGAINLAHRRGLKVWIYTVNKPKLAGELLDKGVQGIITNDPAALREAVAAHDPV